MTVCMPRRAGTRRDTSKQRARDARETESRTPSSIMPIITDDLRQSREQINSQSFTRPASVRDRSRLSLACYNCNGHVVHFQQVNATQRNLLRLRIKRAARSKTKMADSHTLSLARSSLSFRLFRARDDLRAVHLTVEPIVYVENQISKSQRYFIVYNNNIVKIRLLSRYYC